MENNYHLSSSPVRQNEHKRWFKSIKDTKGIGGNIIANAYGKNKEEAEKLAKQIAALPILIDTLKKIADWQSFQDHPGRYAAMALKELNS